MRAGTLAAVGLLALVFMDPGSGRLAAASFLQATSLELYGTFEAMGVVLTMDPADDPDGDATASVEYRLQGTAVYQPGFRLTRVSETRFVGSLFWLEPGHSYDVRVTLHDPDGGALDGTVVTGTASTRAQLAIPVANRSLHVSPSGLGTDCNQALPCSLAEGLSQTQPGDQVLLHGGIYYQGLLAPPRAGLPEAPIVIRSHPGEMAVLDGGDPSVFGWAPEGGGLYRTSVNTPDPHLVTASGQRLLPYQSLSDLQDLVWGIPGFYATGTTVHVHLVGGADPNTVSMVVSRYNHAFRVEQDHIYFVDLTFRHYGQGDWAKALYLDNASDNLVSDCTFVLNDLGIGLKRGSHRNVIQDSEFYDTLFDWPWDAFYAGIDLSGGGVRFYSPTSGRGNVIRRNRFHDYFDGFGACPGEGVESTNETDVYDNLVYRAGDDGMETDGQCSNVRIWGNTFRDVLMGISLAPVHDGPVFALRNLVYRTGAGNNDYTGSPFKFNSGYSPSGSIYLFHNTTDAVLPGNNGLHIKAPGAWDLIYARNNVWAGTAYAIYNYNTDPPTDLDYDALWQGGGGDLVHWDGISYPTLAGFQAAADQELHGQSVQPGFAEPGSGEYTLDPSSGLIDAGLPIPGINDDYVGAAPDIGAFEYPGEGFVLSAVPASQGIEPGAVAVYALAVEAIGSFGEQVGLAAVSPSPSLTVGLTPSSILPPAEATLLVTDLHPGPVLLPGLHFQVSVTAAGGGYEGAIAVGLLVGGVRVYLPLVGKGGLDSGRIAVWSLPQVPIPADHGTRTRARGMAHCGPTGR